MEIYFTKISNIDKKKLNNLCLLISDENKYKIQKFINEKDKMRTLIGEILIRTIIIEHLGVSNKNIEFKKNLYGKPYVEDYPNIHFNISHSGEYVLCAFDNKPIGVDIEEIKDIEFEDIIKSFFAEQEIYYIINGEKNTQINRFYDIWTLKESYIKCLGQGLSIPLKSFVIEVDKLKNIGNITNNDGDEYRFKIYDIVNGYKVAACLSNENIDEKVMMFEQDYIINKYLKIVSNKL